MTRRALLTDDTVCDRGRVYFGSQTYRQMEKQPKRRDRERRNEGIERAVPWLIDLISIVLGIFSWAVASTDLRLTLDLNSVFIRVDFPRPLCPVSKKKKTQWQWDKQTPSDWKTLMINPNKILCFKLIYCWTEAVTRCRRRSTQTLPANPSICTSATQTHHQKDKLDPK